MAGLSLPGAWPHIFEESLIPDAAGWRAVFQDESINIAWKR
jgi:hypothetical protein